MRVLVVKTSSMGDLVHTLPALTDAAHALPEIQFDWVCEPGFSEIPHWHPQVNDVLAIPLRKWRGRLHRLLFSREFQAYKNALGAKHYDAVIDAQGLMKSAYLITRFTDGIRHGFAAASARERFASLSYQKKHVVSKSLHAITRNRHLFAMALGYPIPVTEADANMDLGRPIEMANRLVLITQTSRAKKCWLESHWRAVIEDALPQFDDIVLPVGSLSEADQVRQMCADYPVRILAGATLTDVACEIAGSRGVVAVDTGLAHVTDALGVPLLALYGPTAPGLVGPVGPRSQVVKSPSRNMQDVPVEVVMAWVSDLDTGSVESDLGSF